MKINLIFDLGERVSKELKLSLVVNVYNFKLRGDKKSYNT